MKVMKLTTASGETFYNVDHSPELVKRTLERAPDWQKIELVEMAEQEYFAIPASNISARLWGPA